jgi:expansin (peptidoglycan-binding protein)
VTLGDEHKGDYSLGPVEFHGSSDNSCAPYTPDLEKAAGDKLAGVGFQFNGNGELCDACVLVKTRLDKRVIAKVITATDTSSPGDVNLSHAAFDAIHEDDPLGTPDHPRPGSWILAVCPQQDKIAYQFSANASATWTSLWVRNVRVPVSKVEVKGPKHADFTALTRETTGAFTDSGGFGDGPFTIRVASIDGQVVTDSFPTFQPSAVLASQGNFQ